MGGFVPRFLFILSFTSSHAIRLKVDDEAGIFRISEGMRIKLEILTLEVERVPSFNVPSQQTICTSRLVGNHEPAHVSLMTLS